MFDLSYKALKVCQLKGMRNGNWRLLDRVQKGFYRACMVYAKLRGAILNPDMVNLLGELIQKLRSTMRVRALQAAAKEVERLSRIYLRAGVFRWAPQLRAWLRDEAYKFWLAITRLSSPVRHA